MVVDSSTSIRLEIISGGYSQNELVRNELDSQLSDGLMAYSVRKLRLGECMLLYMSTG